MKEKFIVYASYAMQLECLRGRTECGQADCSKGWGIHYSAFLFVKTSAVRTVQLLPVSQSLGAGREAQAGGGGWEGKGLEGAVGDLNPQVLPGAD